MAKLSVEEESLKRVRPQAETLVEVPQVEQQVAPKWNQQPAQQQAPQPDPKAKAWADKNDWFGDDLAMTTAAFAFHRQLTEGEGYDPTSEDYYKEVDRILEKHSKLVIELKEIQPSKIRDIEDLVDEMIEVVEQDSNLIPFNLAHLDMFAGGMTRKELTVLGGRPGHGKTTLVINMIQGLIKQGFRVMLFNREMSNTEMLKKMVVMESKALEYTNIRRNDLSEADKKDFELVSSIIKGEYANLIMYDGIRSLDESLREIAKHKPDVVIDDYIQLIEVNGVKEGRRFEIEKIMREYKWICKTENCTAILVSQLNREIEKRLDPRPRMSDYSESGVIEQTAESAMFVFYGYNFDNERYSPYKSEIIVAKSRYGKIGTHKVGFNGNRCKFYMNSNMAQTDNPVKNVQ